LKENFIQGNGQIAELNQLNVNVFFRLDILLLEDLDFQRILIMPFNINNALKRLQILVLTQERLQEIDLSLEEVKIKNEKVRKSIREARKELARHINQIKFSIRKRNAKERKDNT
jgi:hypothetical protein